jgi:hypothetical protein
MTQEAAVWTRLEEHSKEIHSAKERLAVVESKHNEIKNKQDDMCIQLQVTDRRISEKLDLLIAEYHKRQGQSVAVSWMPTIISTAVSLTVIYTFIKVG